MLQKAELYYFSPTGGTKKVGECFAQAAAEKVRLVDLMHEKEPSTDPGADVAVIAMPVFGGRVPEAAVERLRRVQGNGRRAVTIAVYGNRAYEDALLEMNNVAQECGFKVVAGLAAIAQHSMLPIVAAGRPDELDVKELKGYAEKVLAKIEKGGEEAVTVPGDFPYKPHMARAATPVSLPACNHCETCVFICPTGAIKAKEAMATDPEQCILCMACVAACPQNARVLPDPMKAHLEQRLGPLKDVRRENELFL